MVRINKQGQSGSNAAILIIIITVLIVLYILFLPPADREALLANNSATSNSSTTGQVLLKESPGVLDYISDNEREYDFPSFTISTQVKGEVLTSRSSLYVKNSVFERKEETIIFTANPELTDKVILSFNIEKADGSIQVSLNGETILNSELQEGNSPPITIDSNLIQSSNELKFSASSPGVAFWRYNEYALKDVKITADVTDKSQSENIQTIILTKEDLKNLKSAQLRYSAICNKYGVSNMKISVNGMSIFEGIPDCGLYLYAPVAQEILVEGQNRFTFKIDSGSVLIDRMRLTNTFETEINPTYYFEMEEDNFTDPEDPDDYELNTNLDVFIDLTFPNTNQKRFEIFINGKKLGFNTAKTKESRQIDNYVRPGTNSVEIRPLQDMTMTEVKIRIKRV